jgi:hypothetical protein
MSVFSVYMVSGFCRLDRSHFILRIVFFILSRLQVMLIVTLVKFGHFGETFRSLSRIKHECRVAETSEITPRHPHFTKMIFL